jgi:tRNA dimethylallyltransferase
MKIIAIIGSTASGKSNLAFKLAQKFDGCILSLDTLSIYKHIDIVSAKPSNEELNKIKHFAIDIRNPDENFSIMDFIEVFKEAKEYALKNKKVLIIAGGSSFYLKSMIDGISILPVVNDKIKEKAKQKAKDLEYAYKFLYKLDKKYMQDIKQNDRYRITRAFEIYLSTNETMSTYFKKHPRINVIDKKDIDIFHLYIDKEELHQRITKRTISMIELGLIEEIKNLRKKYGDNFCAIKSIGIKESLDYIDDKSTKEELIEQISLNTRKLAKRQRTFNKTQFENIVNADFDEIYQEIVSKEDRYKI